VAARLKVCRATVYRMIAEGRLPAVRVSSGAIRVVAIALADPPR
jgi:excisionase family DNA binding protein